MSLDRDALAQAIAKHGTVARVVVASVKGSAPREPGASMLVWRDGQSGTIGGGALEYEAAAAARQLIPAKGRKITRAALGPALNQCCGGAVALVTEVFTAADIARIPETAHARRVEGHADMPLSMHRALADMRGQGRAPDLIFDAGWLLEPCRTDVHPVWIYGAGHVGRALVAVLAPLPQFDLTWIDTSAERFPQTLPDGVTRLPAQNPARLVAHAPHHAIHIVLTYSHALDLDLCHALLGHGFHTAGLIGSKTKWARFRTRLKQLGHSEAEISKITCPIGEPALGKHPQAIAVGVAGDLLAQASTHAAPHTKNETGCA